MTAVVGTSNAHRVIVVVVPAVVARADRQLEGQVGGAHARVGGDLHGQGYPFLTQNCIQADIQSTNTLPHMILNISERLKDAHWGVCHGHGRSTTFPPNKTYRTFFSQFRIPDPRS